MRRYDCDIWPVTVSFTASEALLLIRREVLAAQELVTESGAT
jgi:hypothetical protein